MIVTDLARVPAKLLSEMALPSFCPSCWWVKYRFRNRMPMSFFPGIFAVLDSWVKRLAHGWFDRHGEPPPWLKWGKLTNYIPEPKNFSCVIDGVQLVGIPDDLFEHVDGIKIGDYKTSAFKGKNDILFPLYQTQLSLYGLIADSLKLGPTTDLALIYCSPDATDDVAAKDDLQSASGFSLPFRVHLLEVDPVPNATLLTYLKAAREFHDMQTKPEYDPSCKDCQKCSSLASALTPTNQAVARAFANTTRLGDEEELNVELDPISVWKFVHDCGLLKSSVSQALYRQIGAL